MIFSMRLILLALIFAGTVAMTREQSWADDGNSPTMNVVLFLIDDLGWMDLGCQGSKYYQTPNIDRLSDEGTRFTDAYACLLYTSPSPRD